MRYLIILFWFAVVLIKPTIAQIKFLDREQKALSFGVDYSKNDRYQTKGGQLSFSNEGKILWGFLYGRSNTPTINILGFFLEGNILKPSQRIPIGVNGLFAFSKSWYSIPGNATVFIFPDLNTGNTTYKAVQRTSGAVSIGPVLQGLNKPVNDLSRGCTIPDILNTVAITAIQAQQVGV